MKISYIQEKNSTQSQGTSSTTFSILDSSSQSEGLQRKADLANNAAQREEAPRPNNTGMPDNLKAGIESLSGFSMDDVRVHYNSSKPATVQALAYTQGTDIHVAPGQEKHLPHEAWHVAQQMAGRVSPTTNINGMPVNDNAALEHEADVMGEKAVTQRKANDCLDSKKIDGNSKKTCQMLRVINAYEFFEINSSTLGRNTNNLRNKYLARAEKILNECFATTPPVNREKLKPYAPKTWEYGNEIQIEQEYKARIRENDDKSTDYPSSTKEFIDKNENLVINAHGSLKLKLFAGMTPTVLAEKLTPLLPNDYCGEIYLAGCHTGEQKVGGSSYIEEFKEKLLEEGKSNGKHFNPSLKGNMNTAISKKRGVYVREGGNMNVTGTHFITHTIKGKTYKYYRGKGTKLHIARD